MFASGLYLQRILSSDKVYTSNAAVSVSVITLLLLAGVMDKMERSSILSMTISSTNILCMNHMYELYSLSDPLYHNPSPHTHTHTHTHTQERERERESRYNNLFIGFFIFDIHMSVHRKYKSKLQPTRCNVS